MELIQEWTQGETWKKIISKKSEIPGGRPLNTTNAVKGRLAPFVHAVRQGATGNWNSGWIEGDEGVTKHHEEFYNEGHETSSHQVLVKSKVLEDTNMTLIDEEKVSDVYLLEPYIPPVQICVFMLTT